MHNKQTGLSTVQKNKRHAKAKASSRSGAADFPNPGTFLNRFPPRKKRGTSREKILATALDLFYKQGYPSTGINQIIEQSGVAKASFYAWFPSKEDLARAYLDSYATLLTGRLQKLLGRSRTLNQFFHRWVSVLKRDVKAQGKYHGCPLLNFAIQTGSEVHDLEKIPMKTVDGWIDLVNVRLIQSVADGEIPNQDTMILARRIVHAFTGAHAMWRITHDAIYITDLEGFFRAIARDAGLK